MTMTTTLPEQPVRPALPRTAALRLAADEYRRVEELLRGLRPADWAAPTECPDWDVRALAAHMLGMVEMAASLREQMRQVRAARRRGGVFINALTALQVDERAEMTPEQLIARFAARWPKAVAGRRRAPSFVRRRPMPMQQTVGGHQETWALGYLIDIVMTRDPWMHRVDLVRATGAAHVLTAAHDGVLVADVVADWAKRHGRPFTLRLTGPAGGTFSAGSGGPQLEYDAIEFCRVLSGRGAGTGLLSTQVPF